MVLFYPVKVMSIGTQKDMSIIACIRKVIQRLISWGSWLNLMVTGKSQIFYGINGFPKEEWRIELDDPCSDILPLVKRPDKIEQDRQTTIYLSIEGINCGNCANRVRNSLMKIYGVTSVIIDPLIGLCEVRFNPTLTSLSALVDTVAATGNDGVHHYAAYVISQK